MGEYKAQTYKIIFIAVIYRYRRSSGCAEFYCNCILSRLVSCIERISAAACRNRSCLVYGIAAGGRTYIPAIKLISYQSRRRNPLFVLDKHFSERSIIVDIFIVKSRSRVICKEVTFNISIRNFSAARVELKPDGVYLPFSLKDEIAHGIAADVPDSAAYRIVSTVNIVGYLCAAVNGYELPAREIVTRSDGLGQSNISRCNSITCSLTAERCA